MPQTATRIVQQQKAPAETPTARTSTFRDFTQPWLDLNDKTVLVTGGTGSFGKHFLKTVVENYRAGLSAIEARPHAVRNGTVKALGSRAPPARPIDCSAVGD